MRQPQYLTSRRQSETRPPRTCAFTTEGNPVGSEEDRLRRQQPRRASIDQRVLELLTAVVIVPYVSHLLIRPLGLWSILRNLVSRVRLVTRGLRPFHDSDHPRARSRAQRCGMAAPSESRRCQHPPPVGAARDSAGETFEDDMCGDGLSWRIVEPDYLPCVGHQVATARLTSAAGMQPARRCGLATDAVSGAGSDCAPAAPADRPLPRARGSARRGVMPGFARGCARSRGGIGSRHDGRHPMGRGGECRGVAVGCLAGARRDGHAAHRPQQREFRGH